MSNRKILIPLDSTAFSREILPHVKHLFSPEAHQLILMRVAQHWEGEAGDPLWIASTGVEMPLYIPNWSSSPGPTVTGANAWQELLIVLQEELEAEVRSLEEAGYEVSVAVHVGDPANASRFLSSASETVLRNAHCSVLVVRQARVHGEQRGEVTHEPLKSLR